MKKFIYTLAACAFVLAGCTNDRVTEDAAENAGNRDRQPGNYEDYRIGAIISHAIKGQAYVKMSEEAAEKLMRATGDIDVQTFSSISEPISLAAQRVGVKSVERMFTPNKEFEERHRKYGLHLWYIVSFDEETETAEAIKTLNAVPEFDLIEPVFPIQTYGVQVSPAFTDNEISQFQVRPATHHFTDPQLGSQWHYNNLGTAPAAKYGADINLFEAWKRQTGKPNVIVSVIDDGVDVTHEDLKENLWVNTKETPDNNKDDDNNGFVDDIHGTIFVKNGRVGGHGSHVAGTVAARNNNGKGVCGVAGGDGTKDSGVRIMACLAIDSRPKNQRTGSNPADAMVYSADHGAVISQNSWGYPPKFPMSDALKASIDYFIDNAGKDKQGNQRKDSPMKGGVVIFAAANDNQDEICYPAAYERVIAVSAMSTNFTRASYTNRGAWVDIMAPGGDIDKYGTAAGVLSTVPDNKYAYYQGTSMAAPHVSGVAALILSEHGKEGYTNEDLKKALLSSFLPVDIDEENPTEKGRLGKGYLNAALAFDIDQSKAPGKPTKDKIEAAHTSMKVSWKVPADEDDKTPFHIYLYMSKEPITVAGLNSLTPIKIQTKEAKAGDTMEYTFNKLKSTSTYYFALVAVDRWGNRSEAEIFSHKTLHNNFPTITLLSGSEKVKIVGKKDATLTFKVEDADGHKTNYGIKGETRGVSMADVKGVKTIVIRPVLPAGEYSFTIYATDELDDTTEKTITFTVLPNNPLKLSGSFSDMVVGLKQSELEIPVLKNFTYDADFPATVMATSSDESVLKTTVVNNVIKVTPVKKGTAGIRIKVSDEVSQPIETSVKVRVVADVDAPVQLIYPMPVTTKLNVLLNAKIQNARVKIVTLAGKVVLNKEVTVSADNIVTLDVSRLAPNSYRLIVESSNFSRFEQLFVK